MNIRKIEINDNEEYCKLQFRAYPSMRFSSKAEWEDYLERTQKSLESKEFTIYGSFNDKHLVGSLMLYHYQINYLGEWLPAVGIGSVAVDLLHKREHICREMMAWAEETMLTSQVPLGFLFPFRPPFYVPMGYGYGPLLYHYEIDPSQIPNQGDKSKIIYLTKKDIPLIRDFENRLSKNMHGYIQKQDRELNDYFDRLSWQKIGYLKDNQLKGWMVFNTKQPDPKNFLRNHLYIYEWWTVSSEVRQSFLSFLHSQKDQYEKVVYHTVDASLIHVIKDPRDDMQKLVPPFISHPVGQISTSIFYSVLDPQRLMQKIISYKGKSNVVPFDWEIQKPFPQEHIVKVSWSEEGQVYQDKPIISATQSIASSILMGALTLNQAVTWNLATVKPMNKLAELDSFLSLPIPYGTPNC
jgi:hypothetical protein